MVEPRDPPTTPTLAMPIRRDFDPEPPTDTAAAGPELPAALGPLLAGARAGGLVDGLEMLGVGAVLIDATGRVLHAGPRGLRLMAGWLRIVAEHLVAERPGDDRAVAALIGAALAGRPSPSGIRLRTGVEDPVLTLRAVMVPQRGDAGPGPRAAIVLDEA